MSKLDEASGLLGELSVSRRQTCSCQSRITRSVVIRFTPRIFKEGRTFVAYAIEFDVSSCGGTKKESLKNLKEAIRLFLEEAEKMGTLNRILQEWADSRSGTQIRSRDSSM